MDGLAFAWLAMAVGGAGLLGINWLGLSGRYQGWAVDDGHGPDLMLAFLPALGLTFLLAGVDLLLNELGVLHDDGWIAGAVLVTAGVLAPVAMVITWMKPRWWGPRWYRQRLGIWSPPPSWSSSDAGGEATDQGVGDDPASRLDPRLSQKPLRHWPARFIDDFDDGTGTDGHLYLLPEELVFLSSKPLRETAVGQAALRSDSSIPERAMDAPVTVRAPAPEITAVQLRSELQWQVTADGPIKHFRPEAPFLWIPMRPPDEAPQRDGEIASTIHAFVVSQPEQAARRISKALKRPLQDLR